MKETKDIQYFLEEEKKFRKEHPDYGELFFDEKYGMREIGDEDSASFLVNMPIGEYYKP